MIKLARGPKRAKFPSALKLREMLIEVEKVSQLTSMVGSQTLSAVTAFFSKFSNFLWASLLRNQRCGHVCYGWA